CPTSRRARARARSPTSPSRRSAPSRRPRRTGPTTARPSRRARVAHC
ncbi:MAG: hypothetical protein AVDCRST_MAG54-2121, partial [uncultured Actinomycetospora sp.]